MEHNEVSRQQERRTLAELSLDHQDDELPLHEIMGPEQIGAETVALLALRRRNPEKTQDITI